MELDFGVANNVFKQCFTVNFEINNLLSDAENNLTKGFSEKRLLHFHAGRFCAKTALMKITGERHEILAGEDGEPFWPKGFIGSISHSDDLVGALVSEKEKLISIGLDIEQIGRVKPRMWDLLFTPEEQIFLTSRTSESKDFYTTLFTSMKESFYKLQFPLTGKKLWFTDFEIHEQNSQFKIAILPDFELKSSFPELTTINYVEHGNNVICFCYLEK